MKQLESRAGNRMLCSETPLLRDDSTIKDKSAALASGAHNETTKRSRLQ